jgi:hypothetical protein
MRLLAVITGGSLFLLSSCNTWFSAGSEQPPKHAITPARESPALGKGKVRVTVRNIKSEKQAWFQNCLNFQASERAAVSVGCNKKKPGVNFLEEQTPIEFEVTKGENVTIRFDFETWESTSSCITYDACANPYPVAPTRRSIAEGTKSVLCYKAGPGAYRLFYEDQPDTQHTQDAAMRASLVIKGTSAPAPKFNPAHPAEDLLFAKKANATFDSTNFTQNCVLQKALNGDVPESALQECIGIDWRDLVVDIEAADNAITIQGLSSENCQLL